MRVSTRISLGIAAALGASALATAAIGVQAARRVPRDGRMATIDGGALHYVDIGTGPAIVMIHGLGGQLRNFTYALAGRLSDRYRVVLVDRPGAGWSTPAPGRFPLIADQAATIGRLIDHLGLERPLVVGHSLGGAVALALGLERPGDLAGLALIAPLIAPPQRLPRVLAGPLLRAAPVRALLARTIGVPAFLLLKGRRDEHVFAPEAMPADFDAAGGMATLRRAPVLAATIADVTGLADAMTALHARYGELALPVEILAARGDRVLDAEGQAAALPGARLTLCQGGHMIPVTQPDLVARWIADVYARCGKIGG